MTAVSSDPPSSQDVGHGGVTLLDLLVAISGSWAIPLAVLNTLGDHSAWRFPAYLVGGLVGLLWAWYSRGVEYVIRKVLQIDNPALSVGVAVFLFVVALGLLVQYGLYRLLRLALGALVH